MRAIKRPLNGFIVVIACYAKFLFACTSCLCGDPTLTTLGTEKPYAGRIQLGWEAIYRKEESDIKTQNYSQIKELRHTLNMSYWPQKNIGLAAALPITSTLNIKQRNGAEQEGSGLGDAELNLRYYHWQNRKFNAGWITGLRLATGSEQTTADGRPITIDAQPAQGIYQARMGVWHSYYNYPWAWHNSALYYSALNEGYQGFESGDQITLNSLGQYAIKQTLSVLLGLEGRSGKYDTFYNITDKDSGGTVGYGVVGIAGQWFTSSVWHLKAQVALHNDLKGNNDEPFVIYTGLSYGF